MEGALNHPDANSDALLSCGQVAALFRVTARTVTRWVDNDQLQVESSDVVCQAVTT